MSGSSIWKKASGGTYIDRKVPGLVQVVFVVLVLVLVLLPFVGMLWAPTGTTTENRSLAELPALYSEDGSFNESYLKDLGTYFDDHFAYRNQMVDANAHLRALVGESATDQVVIGTNDWLFYGGTLPDYLGQTILSDRALANIAHNLALAQGYVESRDAAFVFTLAPNKNSLDWSDMPYYYLRYEGASNAERLKPYLQKEGINYVDLFSFFQGQMESGSGFNYLKQDSHWDNLWALLASNEILEALGHDKVDVDPDSAVERDDFVGDLQSMLYPDSPVYETNQYYAGFNDGVNETGSRWDYLQGADVTDSYIRTGSSSDSDMETAGSILMFRDSFGNAMLPFFAGSFKEATFSKLIPYNLTQINSLEADYVVIERAERHLSYLATNPPIIPNPCYEGVCVPEDAHRTQSILELSQNGSLWELRGTIGTTLDPEMQIYIVASLPNGQEVTFIPFWTSQANEDGSIDSDDGFLVYTAQSSFDLSRAVFTVFVR